LSTIRRRHQERGSVLLITSAVILVLLGFLALSIDVGYVLSGRVQLQNGLDSAALAAAAGMRVAIEPGGSTNHQDSQIITPLAKKFAGFHQVRRYAPVATDDLNQYPDGLKPDPDEFISLDDSDIEIDHSATPPRVKITHRLTPDAPVRSRRAIPTIFANIFGFEVNGTRIGLESIGVGAGAIGSLLPADGGTGMFSGCWRPLMIPDTFFDSSNNVWFFGDPAHPVPDASLGDYYRSRFAGGSRSTFPFVDGAAGGLVTSIRDTKNRNDLKLNGGNNLIGQPVLIKAGDYRVVNFAASYPGTVPSFSTPSFQIFNGGYCGNVRVGDEVTVAIPSSPTVINDSLYHSVIIQLIRLKENDQTLDFLDLTKLLNYSYVTSALFPVLNSNPRIIPVLLCDPFYFQQNKFTATQYKITNIGALFLFDVTATGDITGYFVRELVSGGLPLQPQNSAVPDSNSLPAAVRLIR
jgi:hypothetical protein